MKLQQTGYREQVAVRRVMISCVLISLGIGLPGRNPGLTSFLLA
ncbi:hypothetical protein ACNVED_04570 [Legionella sp. D16C41]